jgi:hypothetical protein
MASPRKTIKWHKTSEIKISIGVGKHQAKHSRQAAVEILSLWYCTSAPFPKRPNLIKRD